MLIILRNLCAALGAVVIAGAAGLSDAAEYPNRDIRMIVPFGPGGNTDIMARIVSERLGKKLGVTVIVDNRGGAGGSKGTFVASKAKADGYTLLVVSGSHVINPSVRKLPYDTVKAFTGISLIAKMSNVLVAHPSIPVNSAKELIAYAKANPGKLNYGSAGTGTSSNLAMELFKLRAGIDIVHIPYKGNKRATADLLAGHVQLMMGAQPSAMPLIAAKKLKGLAVTSLAPSPVLPRVPSLNECCVPGYTIIQGFGVLTMVGVAKDRVNKLNQALVAVLKDPVVVEKLTSRGATPSPMTPDEYNKYINIEIASWAKIAKDAGIKRK